MNELQTRAEPAPMLSVAGEEDPGAALAPAPPSRTLGGMLSPSITKMIRLDHSHATLLFHRYTADASPGRKTAIIQAVCLALQIHAQLEEEIFYPALREADPGHPVLQKSEPEHAQMRRLIEELRALPEADARRDEAFSALVRTVLHHVADEEAVLLPLAERLLEGQLGELGARMTRRRLELVSPRLGEIAASTARALPVATLALVSGVVLAVLLWGRGGGRRQRLARR
jgi:hemerythrin superfamily protein